MATGHVLASSRFTVPPGTKGALFVRSVDCVLAVVSVVQKEAEGRPRWAHPVSRAFAHERCSGSDTGSCNITFV